LSARLAGFSASILERLKEALAFALDLERRSE
jgi:hypothetical protein